jgi:glycosyltransferase involved in cell wall biosynthesis
MPLIYQLLVSNSVPGVSVVIPAFRAAKTICRAIDSVLAQTVRAREIIVVDDGSPDNVADVVKETYGDLVSLLRKENGGAASARNVGIDCATGDVIAFLDADDYWEPDKLQQQIAILNEHPEVGLIAGNWFQESPGESRSVMYPITANGWWDRIHHVTGPQVLAAATMIWTGMTAVTRKALGNERFCTQLSTAEDRDLWIRIAASHPIYLTGSPLATAVLEPGSLSRSGLEGDCKNMLAVVKRYRALLGPIAEREWNSYVLSRWAANEESPSLALAKLLDSFARWPLPYWQCPNRHRFGRLKRLAVLIFMAAGMRK